MKEGKRTFDDLSLERYVLGELGKKEAKLIEEDMARDQELALRVSKIKESNVEILEKYAPHAMTERILSRAENNTDESRAKRSPRTVRRVIYAFGCAAVLASLLVVFLPMLTNGMLSGTNNEGIRVKGDFALKLYRQTASGYEELADRARVSPGERFQLKYRAGNESYGMIFSIDGRGNITLHFPQNGKASPLLSKKGDVPLLDAFELDDAPGFERFFFVASKNVFNVSDVLAKGEELAGSVDRGLSGRLTLASGLSSASVALIKGDSKP
jgi:hypothetical protein